MMALAESRGERPAEGAAPGAPAGWLLNAGAEACLQCGLCVAACPASGFFGLDPRRFARLFMLGLGKEAAASPWVWTCTLCRRCAHVCPAGVDVAALVEAARGTWPEEDKPEGIVRGCRAQLSDPGTSALGVTTERFLRLAGEVSRRIRRRGGRFAGFDIRDHLDRKGAEIVINQASREPAAEPGEMGPLWKILEYVGADWTYATKGWAAENMCMFTGDAAAWEKVLRERIEAVSALQPKVYVNTECGHSFYAIWRGMRRFGIRPGFAFADIVSFYARWIREGRLPVNAEWNVHGLKFTLQDPCQLVRKSRGEAAAEDLRFVAKALVGEENLIEMRPGRSANYCCGGGSGFLAAGMDEKRRAYGRRKFDQIAATGADYVMTPCHNCHAQIADIGAFYGGGYRVVHFWTLICLSLGILDEEEHGLLPPGTDLNGQGRDA